MTGRIKLAGKDANYQLEEQQLARLDYQLVVAARSGRRVQELSQLVQQITWTTKLSGSPGQLEFDLIKEAPASYGEGDLVTLIVNGARLFKGYVFQKESNEKGEIATTCYDQVRYLKARQSYNFANMTAGAMIKKIAADLG